MDFQKVAQGGRGSSQIGRVCGRLKKKEGFNDQKSLKTAGEALQWLNT